MYKDKEEKTFKTCQKNLQKLKFTEPIKKISGHKYHVVIGNIGSGKSSLINFVCGTKLDTGIGEITQECTQVAVSQNGKVHIFDAPGINENFSIYLPEFLKFFHTADRIFILYPDSLSCCRELCLVLSKIKPSNIYAVRTQCDRWKPNHNKSIEQYIERDKQYLEKLGVKMEVFATSAQRDRDYRDNGKFLSLLRGEN